MNLDELEQDSQPVQPVAASQVQPVVVPQVQPQVAPVVVATTPTQVASTPPPVQNTPVQNPYQVAPQPQINVNVNGHDEEIEIEGLVKKTKNYGIIRILILLVLVVTGFLMLGETTDLLSLSVKWLVLSQIYPIVILLSVIVLFSYKKIIGKILGLILFLVIVGWIFGIGTYHSLVPTTTSKFDQSIAYNLQDANQAIVRFNTYIVDYDVSGKVTSMLFEGEHKSDRELWSTTGFTDENVPYLYLTENPNWNVMQSLKTDLDIEFNNQKELNLYFKNLWWMYNFDLTDVLFGDLEIHGGVGDIHLVLWKNILADSEIKIKSIYSSIVIDVPKNIGVQLYYSQLAWSIELTNFQKSETQKWYFESLNLAQTQKVVKIDADVVVGKFKINWID